MIAQEYSVSDPRPELRDNEIHIFYDLLNSNPSDTFAVSLTVTNANGNLVSARSLSGDIGAKVSGGYNKHITWNLAQDRISMNARLFFKIQAKYLPPIEPFQVDGSEGDSQSRIVQSEREVPGKLSSNSFNRTGLIIQSLALPGLGLTRIKGKPHWIKAVAGYGCLAGSVALNWSAVDIYDRISDEVSYDDKNTLFNQAIKQDQISEILAYAAIGIWVTDFIWTLVGTSNLNTQTNSDNNTGFSIGGYIDPVTLIPQLAISYRFSVRPQ